MFMDDGFIECSTSRLDTGFVNTVKDIISVLPEGPGKRMGFFKDLFDSIRRGAVDANGLVVGWDIMCPLSSREAFQEVFPSNGVLSNNQGGEWCIPGGIKTERGGSSPGTKPMGNSVNKGDGHMKSLHGIKETKKVVIPIDDRASSAGLVLPWLEYRSAMEKYKNLSTGPKQIGLWLGSLHGN
jgi:hypothetical protein